MHLRNDLRTIIYIYIYIYILTARAIELTRKLAPLAIIYSTYSAEEDRENFLKFLLSKQSKGVCHAFRKCSKINVVFLITISPK